MLFLAIYLTISLILVFKNRHVIFDVISNHKEEISQLNIIWKILLTILIILMVTLIEIPLDIILLIKTLKRRHWGASYFFYHIDLLYNGRNPQTYILEGGHYYDKKNNWYYFPTEFWENSVVFLYS